MSRHPPSAAAPSGAVAGRESVTATLRPCATATPRERRKRALRMSRASSPRLARISIPTSQASAPLDGGAVGSCTGGKKPSSGMPGRRSGMAPGTPSAAAASAAPVVIAGAWAAASADGAAACPTSRPTTKAHFCSSSTSPALKPTHSRGKLASTHVSADPASSGPVQTCDAMAGARATSPERPSSASHAAAARSTEGTSAGSSSSRAPALAKSDHLASPAPAAVASQTLRLARLASRTVA
mmetsp:Transcript_4515/g.19184  ORF Transcript_4515/g.19184 Transcript_4515/m.19184 type:complete len:241 (+) Transcript_4515:2951-3673(+)